MGQPQYVFEKFDTVGQPQYLRMGVVDSESRITEKKGVALRVWQSDISSQLIEPSLIERERHWTGATETMSERI
jgi:hypothetical protein